MKRKFTLLIAALALLTMIVQPGRAWGQSDYSSDYTGNITLSIAGGSNASTCVINISENSYNGIKAGTSSKAGAVKITVPSGTKYLHMHLAGWTGKSVTLAVTPSGYSSNISLTSDSGISGNSPFTFSGDPSSSDFYKVITFDNALSADTDLTFTATSGNRFVVWGVTSEVEGSGSAVATTTTITVPANFNTDIYNGTTAGMLTATVKETESGNPVSGATITWSSTNENVATIDEYGNVTLVAVGSTTLKANYAGVENTYNPSSANHQIIVTNSDPNVPGTVNNPYTVAQAHAAIDAGTGTQGVYATGIVSQIVTPWGQNNYQNITFNIVDNTSDEEFLQAFRCVGDEGPNVIVGDIVVVTGNLTKYGSTYEFAQGCTIVSLTHTTTTHTLTYSVTPQDGGSMTVGTYSENPATVAEGAEIEITATPNTGYTFGSWIVSGAGSSVADENAASTTFTMGTENATLTANFTVVNTYTVTYHANVPGTTDIEYLYNEGEDVTIANNTFSNPGHAFTKWNTNENGSGTDYMPGAVIQSIATDYELWAQWEQSSEATDVLNWAATGSPTNYTDWTYTAPSGTAYAGQSSGTYQSIQLRSNNNNSGIITTTSVGTATKVVVVWNSNTTGGRTLNIYGKNTAYEAVTDLYGDNAGELLGSIVCGTSTELTISGGYAFIGMRAASGAMYFDEIDITWNTSGVLPPSISANDIELTYDATEGEIEYTINNEPTSAGTLTASTTETWLSLSTAANSAVPFNCDPNQESTARTATVTLTYTYGDNQTVTKDVTVTQAGAPVIYTTISDLFAAATSTATDVTVAFDNWHVTGISTNGKNVFVTDGTNGFVIYDNDGGLNNIYTVNDDLSGTTTASLKLQNGFAQLTSVDADQLTLTQGSDIDYADIAMANLAGVNTGALIHYENLTCSVENNKYYLSDGTTQLQVYNSLFAFEALVSGKVYNISGVYQQYNTTKEVLPRNANDIEETVEPSITVNPTEVNATAAETVGTIDVTLTAIANNDIAIEWFESDGTTTATYNHEWIQTDITTDKDIYYVIGENTGDARSAYFKVFGLDIDDNYVYSNLVTINQAAHEAANVTWDLSTDQTATATTTEMTWTSAYATMAVYKANSGTNTNNYYPGTPGQSYTSTRFYKNSELTIAPVTGYAITSVVFEATTEGYASALANSTWTNATASTNTTTVTITPTNGNDAIMAVIGGTCGFTSVKVYYEESTVVYYDIELLDVQNGSIESNKIKAQEGETITLTATPDNNYYVSDWTILDNQTEPVTWTAVSSDLKEVTFVMPNSKVYVDATFATDVVYYTVNVDQDIEHGTISANPVEALEGTTITLTATPATGYILDENNLIVLAGSQDVEVTKVNATTYTFEMPASNVDVTAEFTEFVGATYTLATSIEGGRRYIITNGSDRAMGAQNNNNRAAVEITTTGNVAQVSSSDVVELIINGPDANGFYTIYDANIPGYLYAASNSSNHLKTREFNSDGNSQWTITLEAAGNAVIQAQGNNNRNLMRYNTGSDIFSCYGSGQDPIYLYMKDEQQPQYTFIKDIIGFGNDTEVSTGFYLIATPTSANPADVPGMTGDVYDLYTFNQSAVGTEWANYKQNPFNLVPGTGYLYAHSSNVTLKFEGAPYTGTGDIDLAYDNDASLKGWNLVGNPYNAGTTIGKPSARLDENGEALIAFTENDPVGVMEGVFVHATEPGQKVTFTPSNNSKDSKAIAKTNIMVANANGTVVDNVIIRFDGGRTLEKFSFRDGNTKLYIPQDDADYAIVNSNATGEVSLYFKAATTGNYTISMKQSDADLGYLHLIDRLTGADVNMLLDDYTFVGSPRDTENRFIVRFSENSYGMAENNYFAYQNGEQIIVNGNGELQVFDATGRMVMNTNVNGIQTVNVPATGMYIFRMVGESVQTQKIVVR